LLPVALLPVGGSKALKTTKVRPTLVAMAVVVVMLVAPRITFFMVKVGTAMILGKIG
jgi:hypothetical protein